MVFNGGTDNQRIRSRTPRQRREAQKMARIQKHEDRPQHTSMVETSVQDKSLVIKFIAEEYQNERHREKLAGKTIFVTTEDYCNKDSSIGMTTRQELKSTQEEANTRVFLHGPHAAAEGYRAVVITSDDTDVYVLFLTFKGFISCPVFVKRSQQTRTVYMDVSRIVRMLDSELCRSLPGL